MKKYTVNGESANSWCDEHSTFNEINLTCFQLKLGDSVKIILYCKKDCKLKFYNPEVLFPRSTFVITKIEIDSLGNLIWETNEEKGNIPYIIEQFRWNKWTKIGTVTGQGKERDNRYTFIIPDLNSGKNIFRVKQLDYTSQPHVSDSLVYFSTNPEVTTGCGQGINFSRKTSFEVYDVLGNIVKKGYDSKIDVSDLATGV
ncbi:MAG TPA: hypothetical protein VI112_05030, partial [Bacteroidia bacterium]